MLHLSMRQNELEWQAIWRISTDFSYYQRNHFDRLWIEQYVLLMQLDGDYTSYV